MNTFSHRVAYGCLGACIPADATRFLVHDEDLASTLALTGAQVVRDRQREVDVEITAGVPLEGEAPCLVVSFEVDIGGGAESSRLARSTRRLVGHALARTRTVTARLALRRHGHRRCYVVWWDRGHRFRLPRSPRVPNRLSLNKRLPQRVAVVGFRGHPTPTVLDTVLAEARMRTGRPLRPGWSTAGTGGQLIVMTDSGVLRVAIGPGRRRVRSQVEALQALWSAQPPAEVRDRAPRLLAHGTRGLASWSLEERLAGRGPSVPLSGSLLGECLGFLVALHRCGEGTGGNRNPAQSHAATVSRICTPEQAERMRTLAVEVDHALEALPRGFAHGDFWPANLLVAENQLLGVVDWFTAGPGRLPALDLLNLHLSLHRPRGSLRWGPALVEQLLPWATNGGDELFRAYCRRVGIELDPRRLRLLVAAYWLERVANTVDHYLDRARRLPWVRNNVEVVLRALLDEHDGGFTEAGRRS